MSTVTRRSQAASGAIRVQLYSHDSQGLGHARRNLALAHTLAQQLPRLTGRAVTGMLLTGLDTPAGELPAGFDAITVPGVRKAGGRYTPRHVRVPMSDLIAVRSRILAAAILGFRPDLLVVDRHAHGIDGELREALAALRVSEPDAKVVLGLREVLDDPAVAAREWTALGDPQLLRHTFDEIWVYGDPRVHDVRTTGELPPELRDLVRYTGYLAAGRRCRPGVAPPTPYVLTMVGGGGDGFPLCRVAAQTPVPHGYGHLIVTGPQMDRRAHREVCRVATPRTRVVERVADGLAAIRQASAVVAMAGYNTTAEVMSTSVPALLVPRERPRMEQAIRAAGLAAYGAVDVCAAAQLTPDVLGRWLDGAVGRRVARTGIDLGGLSAVAHRVADLLPAPVTREVHTLAV